MTTAETSKTLCSGFDMHRRYLWEGTERSAEKGYCPRIHLGAIVAITLIEVKSTTTRMPDKYKCPSCGSGRTKPLSMAVSTGTRRRSTVGLSRRSMWTSQSTYKSDFVSALPTRPSNAGSYLLIFLGACGLLFALVSTTVKDAAGFATVAALVSIVVILLGFAGRKSQEELTESQNAWDRTWLCARCGNQWQA